MLGVSESREPEQGTDRDKPRIAGTRTIEPSLLKVLKKGTDQRCIKIIDIEPGWRNRLALRREDQKHSQGIAICGDRMGTDLPLADQSLAEERLQRGRQGGHAAPPKWRSSRLPAKARSSGAAERYQYVLAGST